MFPTLRDIMELIRLSVSNGAVAGRGLCRRSLGVHSGHSYSTSMSGNTCSIQSMDRTSCILRHFKYFLGVVLLPPSTESGTPETRKLSGKEAQ